MSQDIPYATPYPWDNPSVEESQKYANKRLRKRRFIGSGFASIRRNALGRDSRMGRMAKKILRDLLQQHNVEVGNEDDEFDGNNGAAYKGYVSGLNREPVVAGSTDGDVLELARAGRLSLFASLLKNVGESDSPLTTKSLIRNCCLTLRPGDLPGVLDAKDVLLSALHFLSSTFEARSGELPSLPLVRPVQEVGDLEKRSYEKSGEWRLNAILEQVLRLEEIFVSSSSSWKWLRRESFCPRIPMKDETSFFLKGSIPASAAAKKPKGETRKRKAPGARSPSPAPDSNFDSTPVVEATIVADGSPSNSIDY